MFFLVVIIWLMRLPWCLWPCPWSPSWWSPPWCLCPSSWCLCPSSWWCLWSPWTWLCPMRFNNYISTDNNSGNVQILRQRNIADPQDVYVIKKSSTISIVHLFDGFIPENLKLWESWSLFWMQTLEIIIAYLVWTNITGEFQKFQNNKNHWKTALDRPSHALQQSSQIMMQYLNDRSKGLK